MDPKLLALLQQQFAAAGAPLTPDALSAFQQFASPIGQDRIVRKEVSLGFIRELEKPTDHIGLTIAPWLEVATDEVIFKYLPGLSDGLAPARAEDAESELAQKDEKFAGTGRASIVDWAHKDRYKASDVTRYREASRIRELMDATDSLPLTVTSMLEDFQSKVAKDDARRRRMLDNRIEWLIMTALNTGAIAYNDGSIIFNVNYNRPADQAVALQAAANTNFGTTAGDATQQVLGHRWGVATSDPIRDVLRIQEYMYDKYGIRITRAITSRKVLNSIMDSDKFAQRGIIAGVGTGNAVVSGDPQYLIDGWGPAYAVGVLERATGVTFQEYDSVYRTRAIGSNTVVNNRFLPQNKVIFLPDDADVSSVVDDTDIGFAKTLTAPHPEGFWTPGFYEWEEETKDPWGTTRGTGVKAFPVFLHMEMTATVEVMA